jgi:hypothetical protein
MGLDFTNIKDSEGIAVYILHQPNFTQTQQCIKLRAQITLVRPKATVVVLDLSTADAERVRDFYDILPEAAPTVLLVADDDTIKFQWSGHEIPGVSTICYQLAQLNG